MKTMKKLSALFLALVLVLAMVVVPAGAANDTNITVNNALSGVTYKVYQMLDLSYNSSTDSYAYTIEDTDAWYTFLSTGTGNSYVKLEQIGTTNKYSVTWNAATDEATMANFAKIAAANIPASAVVAATYSPTSDGAFTFTETFAAGYYLVTSSVGTAAMIDTVTATGTGTAIEIKEKLVLPTVTKSADKDTACIGEVITFTTTIYAKEGGVNYVLHDKMGSAFSYVGIISVKYDGAVVDTSKYTVATNVNGCAFEISFTSDFCNALENGKAIEVVYTATLNDAAVGNDAEKNTNTAWLTHGSTGDLKTTEATDSVATYSLTIIKTDGTNPLAGAGFTLYDSSNNAIKLYDTGSNTYSVCMLTGCGVHGDTHATEITTDATGTLVINGLGNATYTLKETTVPAGYVGAVDETITISNDNVTANITNTPGTELPPTGGIGTPLFYTIGGILVLAALAVLISKKRAGAAE